MHFRTKPTKCMKYHIVSQIYRRYITEKNQRSMMSSASSENHFPIVPKSKCILFFTR